MATQFGKAVGIVPNDWEGAGGSNQAGNSARGRGGGHSGLRRYPLLNGRTEQKRRMLKIRGGQLLLGQNREASNEEHNRTT